jgi:eukaryotic-like serine/threonine-protein kinase
VLYELLTSRRPHHFTTGPIEETERAICETDPEKPSSVAAWNDELSPGIRKQLSRQLAGDLDKIVLTAMRKQPERRYASAAQLSDDLRSHMEALPILAQEDRLDLQSHQLRASPQADRRGGCVGGRQPDWWNRRSQHRGTPCRTPF